MEDNKKLLFEVDYSRYENKLLIGLSRKGFLNKIFQKSELKDLDEKSTFASIIASERGANILRIHNVSMLSSKINESK